MAEHGPEAAEWAACLRPRLEGSCLAARYELQPDDRQPDSPGLAPEAACLQPPILSLCQSLAGAVSAGSAGV